MNRWKDHPDPEVRALAVRAEKAEKALADLRRKTKLPAKKPKTVTYAFVTWDFEFHCFRVYTTRGTSSPPPWPRRVWRSISPVVHFRTQAQANAWIKKAGYRLTKRRLTKSGYRLTTATR